MARTIPKRTKTRNNENPAVESVMGLIIIRQIAGGKNKSDNSLIE